MIYKRQLYFLSLILLPGAILGTSSCRTAKKAMKTAPVPASEKPSHAVTSSNLSPGFLLSKLKENTIQYQTFSAKAKLDLITPKESQKGIATYIRMKKDSAIWISIRPVLGIELVRVFITPDTVKMINFFKKTITIASSDSMQEILNIPYNFKSLQELIMGNPIFIASPENIRSDSDMITFSATDGYLISDVQLSAVNYRMQSNKLMVSGDTGDVRYSRQNFEDYNQIGDQYFSQKRTMIIHNPETTHVELKFSRVDLNKALSFPFPEPDGFRRN